MKLVSLQVAQLRPLKIGSRVAQTGHFKEPLAGPVRVEWEGLAGDAIGDHKHHGGPDQAVYLYSAADYAWWEQRLGRQLAYGTFGDNITVDKLPPAFRLGDIWNFGSVQLQVTGPRIPCSTLAARMGLPKFVKEFATANRGGAYARVLTPGLLEVGQKLTVDPYPHPAPSVDSIFELWHQADKDPELMRLALTTPLAVRARAALEHWLSKA